MRPELAVLRILEKASKLYQRPNVLIFLREFSDLLGCHCDDRSWLSIQRTINSSCTETLSEPCAYSLIQPTSHQRLRLRSWPVISHIELCRYSSAAQSTGEINPDFEWYPTRMEA